jgi:hypothetical protein
LGKKNNSVYFEDCPLITDFSSLREVQLVRIRRGDGFTNGHHISGAKIIILDHCSNIHDVSMLGNAEQVELQSCDGISSVEGLENVPTIVIETCRNLKPLKGLGRGRNEIITLDYGCDDEPNVEFEDDNNDSEWEDNDMLILKSLRPHPLTEDPVLKEYLQFVGSDLRPATGRTGSCYCKKR